ncbi:PA0069 family radical SAM protein [uncultured Sphaerotilus sp.]|uniref:PA0069 family radical SAM protein n=1 Tax=uncultured Sphaerotilus sp. TaxID=474984 RepID=UPI0030CA53A2
MKLPVTEAPIRIVRRGRPPAAAPTLFPDDLAPEPVAVLPGPGSVKGRGTAWRIAGRYERRARHAVDDGWDSLDQRAEDDRDRVTRTEVIDEPCKSLLRANDSPDVPFELSINPYRGCEHGCIYCYARPTHSYADLSPGLDFETRILAKTNAADRLREELRRPRYTPRPLNLGSATDAYQPVERSLKLTRQIIEVLHEAQHPFSVVTKSGGIVRDLDLLADMAQRQQVLVFISLTTLDNDLARILEPRASAPARRLAAIRALSDAGVWVGVNVAPVIPFINEPEIEQIIEAAAGAGAKSLHWTVVRLPWEVNPLFQQWLEEHFPDRAHRVMERIRDLRGGQDYDADFSTRMKGEGIWADLIRQRMLGAAHRHSLVREVPTLDFSRFQPPRAPVPATPPDQGELF